MELSIELYEWFLNELIFNSQRDQLLEALIIILMKSAPKKTYHTLSKTHFRHYLYK